MDLNRGKNRKSLWGGVLLIVFSLCALGYLWFIDARTMILPTDDPELTFFEWSRGIATGLLKIAMIFGFVWIFITGKSR